MPRHHVPEPDPAMLRKFFVNVSIQVPGQQHEWAGFLIDGVSKQGVTEAVIDMGIPYDHFTVTIVNERQRIVDRVHWWKSIMRKPPQFYGLPPLTQFT